MMIPSEKVIVALDVSEMEKALHYLELFSGKKIWVKIGMELFYSAGPDIIYKAKEKGFCVFLDLKLHDIPHTVGEALKALVKLPIDMMNVHAAGGSEMMKRASEVTRLAPNSPHLIAVTQLTSTSSEQMNQEQRIPGDILESVIHYAKLAKESGLDGVVCSPHEVQMIKSICGNEFITVTPGIRPLTSHQDDQKRITTPQEALKLGTDFMVIGRPITTAQNPQKALENILQGH
jgi:orotidine-5'-phosphate decarboxylase